MGFVEWPQMAFGVQRKHALYAEGKWKRVLLTKGLCCILCTFVCLQQLGLAQMPPSRGSVFHCRCRPEKKRKKKKIILDLSPKEQLPPELALVKKNLFSKMKLFRNIVFILSYLRHPGFFAYSLQFVGDCAAPGTVKPHALSFLLPICSSWSIPILFIKIANEDVK